MRSTRIAKIYSALSELFAEQRQSLLSAASAGYDLQDEDKDKFEGRHARIVRLYRELARLNPEAYDRGSSEAKRKDSSQGRVA